MPGDAECIGVNIGMAGAGGGEGRRAVVGVLPTYTSNKSAARSSAGLPPGAPPTSRDEEVGGRAFNDGEGVEEACCVCRAVPCLCTPAME
jgi:hypothetical protein